MLWGSGIAGENDAPVVHSGGAWIGLDKDNLVPLPPVFDPEASLDSIEAAAYEILEHVQKIREVAQMF